jgi:fructose-bisphosphate aldolase class I
MLRDALITRLEQLTADQSVMLKLTLPDTADFYRDLVDHPNVLRVVALSGGYDRETSNDLLAANHGVIASFSRALTEGLTVDMSDEEFNKALDGSIASIYAASIT